MSMKFATALIAAALLLPVSGYAADSPKTIVKDSVITAKIKTEYAKDKQVSALKIEVETDHSGMVKLTGNAKSQAEADKAVEIAKGVQGVTSVQNNIKVGGAAGGTKY
jgi:osmotically-inducible protein OsmY